jgi:hypothetical protein
VQVGLVEVLGIASGSAKSQETGVGLIEVASLGVNSLITADVPIGLIEVLGLELGTAYSATTGIGLIRVSASPPSTAKVQETNIGFVEILGIVSGTEKDTSVGIGLIEVLGIEPEGNLAAGGAVGIGLVEVLGIESGTAKSAEVGVGLVIVKAETCQSYFTTSENDAGYQNSGVIWDTTAAQWAYDTIFGIIIFRTWYRFTGVVPGSRAVLRLTRGDAQGDVLADLSVSIRAELAASSSMPEDGIDANNRTFTDYVTEVYEDVAIGDTIEIDITSIVNEVASLPGWDGTLSLSGEGGPNVTFYLADEGSGIPELVVCSPNVTTAKTTHLDSGLIEVLGVESAIEKSASIGIGLVEILANQTLGGPQGNIGIGLLEVSGIELTTQKSAEIPIGLVVVIGVEPGASSATQLPPIIACGTLTIDSLTGDLSLNNLCGELTTDSLDGQLTNDLACGRLGIDKLGGELSILDCECEE